MTTGCYETSLLLSANARGAGTLLTVNARSPGPIVQKMPRVCRGGMLAAGIDSRINDSKYKIKVVESDGGCDIFQALISHIYVLF